MKNSAPRRVSLKSKLLLLLVCLTGSTLITYAILAIGIFQSDKIAYVFDSETAYTRALTNQLRSELNLAVSVMRPLLANYDPSNQKITSNFRNLFRAETLLAQFAIYQRVGTSTRLAGVLRLKKDTVPQPISKAFGAKMRQLAETAEEYGVSLLADESVPGFWAVAIRFGDISTPKSLVVVALSPTSPFIQDLRNSQLYANYLVDSRKNIVIHPTAWSHEGADIEEMQNVVTELDDYNLPEGAREIATASSLSYLASYSKVGLGELKIITLLQKEKALEAVKVLKFKSYMFVGAFVFFIVLLSVFAANRLTRALKRLSIVTESVSKGKFDVRAEVTSNDEVGGLAESFNQMAGKISDLMQETAQKARMEAELKTAQAVQETLIPPKSFQSQSIEIDGFFQPASECGGDWWHYSKIGSKIFLWIGDATGHGVGAALITSTAKAVASIVEKSPGLTVEASMKLLNLAIYEAAKGKVLMTFFVACIDTKTGKLTYCNASHEPALLIPRSKGPGTKISKKDLIPLVDNNNPRLGQSLESQFTSTSVQLSPDDRLLLYTDGVPEIKNPKGDVWGERNFLKVMIEGANAGQRTIDVVNSISKEFGEFRSQADLDDDVTFFACRYLGNHGSAEVLPKAG